MSPPESNQMLKEQLRMQAKELQKRDAEKEKGDAKIKHILKISQDKIKDLTETVTQKDKEIKQAVREASKSGSGAKDDKLSNEIEKSQKTIQLLKEKLDESKKENTELTDKLGSSSPEGSSTEKKRPQTP